MKSSFVIPSGGLTRTLVALVFCGLCGFSSTAHALTVFSFAGPSNGPVGSASYPVTVGGLTITAHGYNANNTDHNLYWKHGGGDENGLGLVSTLNNELTLTESGSAIANYIQFDVTQVKNATTAQVIVDSVTQGEAFNLYASNSAANIGSLILSGNTTDNGLVNIPGWGSFNFLSVSVDPLGSHHSKDNLLPATLEFTIPPQGGPSVPLPPAAWSGLILLSVVIAVGLRRRNRRGSLFPTAH